MEKLSNNLMVSPVVCQEQHPQLDFYIFKIKRIKLQISQWNKKEKEFQEKIAFYQYQNLQGKL